MTIIYIIKVNLFEKTFFVNKHRWWQKLYQTKLLSYCMYGIMKVCQDTCDHQRRNLIMSQSELSIHRRNNGNKKKTTANIFGSYNNNQYIQWRHISCLPKPQLDSLDYPRWIFPGMHIACQKDNKPCNSNK